MKSALGAVPKPPGRVRRACRRLFERAGITADRVERAAVVTKVCVVLGVLLYPVWLLHIHFYSLRVRELALSLAFSMLTVEALVAVCQIAISCYCKRRTARREERSARVLPLIRAHLASHAGGADRTAALVEINRTSAREVEMSITGVLSVLEGHALESVSRLAADLGLLAWWKLLAAAGSPEQKRHAAHCLGLMADLEARRALTGLLKDPLPAVQAAACRALAARGAFEDIELVFECAIDGPELVRIMVAGILKPHAVRLARTGIARGLASTDTARVAAVLELARAWNISPGLAVLGPLLRHPSAAIRAGAMRLAGCEGNTPWVEFWLIAGLNDPDEQVRATAAQAASMLRMPPAVPWIERSVDQAGDDLARLACHALAAMGPEGWGALERALVAGNRRLAARAAEALGAAQLRPALVDEP